MIKKIIIFLVIFLILLGAYFVYNYFAKPVVKAPVSSNDFQGPSVPPSAKGPTEPPPK